MKNRLVAGLLAAGLCAALFSLPAEARCESTRLCSMPINQVKKFVRSPSASTAKIRIVKLRNTKTVTVARAKTAKVKTKIATVSNVRSIRVKSKIAAASKIPANKVKTKTATVTRNKPARVKIQLATLTTAMNLKVTKPRLITKTESIPALHVFHAPLRLRRELAAPLEVVVKGGSVVAMIESMAPQYGVPTWFALRIAKVESGYNPDARGLAGELGVFQMKCDTARGIGYRGDCAGLLHAHTGVQYGLKHLSIALKSSRGNLKLAASKHNGGLGRKSLVPKYVAQVF